MVKMKPAGKIIVLLAVAAGLYALWRYVLPEERRGAGFRLPALFGAEKRPGRPQAWAPGSKESPIRIAVPTSAAALGGLAANGGADTAPGSMYDADFALAVRFEISESPAEAVEAFAKRDVLFYVTDLSAFVQDVPQLRSRGLDPVVVLLCGWSRGAHAVIADPDVGDIAGPAGHTIAVTRGSAGYFLLRALIEGEDALRPHWAQIRSRLRLTDDDRAAARAYVRKEVDAAVLQDPYVTLAMDQRPSHELVSTRDRPHMIAYVLVADRQWLRDNTDVAVLVARGWLRGSESVRRSPDDGTRLLGEVFSLSAEESETALDHLAVAGVADNRRFFGLGSEASQMTDLVGQYERILRGDLEPGVCEVPARLMYWGPFSRASVGLGE